MIDGLRYGFFEVSDVSPFLSLAVSAVFLAGVAAIALWMLKRGYKLRY
jgi:ABC-2 type transport system permease protein